MPERQLPPASPSLTIEQSTGTEPTTQIKPLESDAVEKKSPRPTAVEPGPFERETMHAFSKHRRKSLVRDKQEGAHGSEDLHDGQPARRKRAGSRPPRAPARAGQGAVTSPGPMAIAAGLSFARALDAIPGLVADLRTGTPCVVVDIGDPLLLSGLRTVWSSLLYGEAAIVEPVTAGLNALDALSASALSVVVTAAPKARDLLDQEREALSALQLVRPIVCLSPDANTCLPLSLTRAADHRFELPAVDRSIVATTIHLVTGRRCRAVDLAALAGVGEVGAADLAIAIRADRTPHECVVRLARLAERRKDGSGVGRDLTLDQLHGLGPAVAWARSTLADLELWRKGAPWSLVSSGAVLAGPPGTGKTLFAAVMAAEGGLEFVPASLAGWQAADQAHLGTTLRAMRESFADAKLKAMAGPEGRRGAVLLIDEIDSLPDRSSLNHDHRDYVVQVVNCLLEQLDGAVGREGVIVIGTTNDASRCEPALLRPGRLNRVIDIGYPGLDDRIGMLRVRLGPDLPGADLTRIGRLTERATGAEIEQLVADARRTARQAERPLCYEDLLAVAGRADADQPPDLLYRVAVHEAGHALLAALETGTDGLVVALQSRGGAGGWVQIVSRKRTAGTRAEIDAEIRVLFAGRAAEEAILGAASAGARSDLAAATSLAASALGAWGLAGRRRLLSGRHDDTDAILAYPELRLATNLMLARLYASTIRTVRRHRVALLAIADRLMVERRLDGAAVSAILHGGRSAGTEPVDVAIPEDVPQVLVEAGRGR